jgi:hypothetical protein
MAPDNNSSPAPKNDLENNNSVDHFLKLYELQLTSFNGRRTTFWTITLSIWTSIILGTGFLYGKTTLPCKTLFYFYFIVFVIVLLWLFMVWFADRCDHDWWDYYRNIAEDKLGIQKKNTGPNKTPKKEFEVPDISRTNGFWAKFKKFPKFIIDGWIVVELMFTLVLMLVSGYLLSLPIPPESINTCICR